jgi:hypothetical protein
VNRISSIRQAFGHTSGSLYATFPASLPGVAQQKRFFH